MTMEALPLQERIELARSLVNSLYDDFDDTVNAVVADGWPEPMVRAGFAMHRRTWDVDVLVDALDRELSGFGGIDALDAFSSRGAGSNMGTRIIRPARIVHIWPALPGAGLTPVLFGMLLGSKQVVRPSSRGEYFADLLHRKWMALDPERVCLAVELGSPNQSWRTADAVVISGADDTIDAVRDFIGQGNHRARPTVLGYGHRVSFSVIVDDSSQATMEQARATAMDIVMWHQKGCFSSRAVIFCGSKERMIEFSERLGAAIDLCERDLGATTLPPGELARRAQARGLAEFTGGLTGGGIGWVQRTTSPWRGEPTSAHAVTLHHVSNVSQLRHVIEVPARHIQGAALYAPAGPIRRSWCEAIASLGATRICAPGMLQSPPGDWSHDGWPNVLDFVRVCRVDSDYA